jgi:hypothetical protein
MSVLQEIGYDDLESTVAFDLNLPNDKDERSQDKDCIRLREELRFRRLAMKSLLERRTSRKQLDQELIVDLQIPSSWATEDLDSSIRGMPS